VSPARPSEALLSVFSDPWLCCRNLRAKLYKESYEFVKQQRIHCLLQGAWFVNAIPMSSPVPRDTVRRPLRPWRFMRLVSQPSSFTFQGWSETETPARKQDNGLKYLHYIDSAVKFPVRSGLEDLPERIEISTISEVATGACAPPPNVLRDSIDTPSLVASPLSFSLLTAHEGSLADQIAPDQSRWADWTDGMNMLRRDGGHVSSRETADFVEALTEIGLKIKLLGTLAPSPELVAALLTPSLSLQIYLEKWWISRVHWWQVLHQQTLISSSLTSCSAILVPDPVFVRVM
jgi:engulfment/cell motility protein 1